jgi:hypothetical protein
MTGDAKFSTLLHASPVCDDLDLWASVRSAHILFDGGTKKQYEDNKKSLLNNPQWRRKMLASTLVRTRGVYLGNISV